MCVILSRIFGVLLALTMFSLYCSPGSECGYERAEGNNHKPSKERAADFSVQSINQQPLHRGGRSNPNQYNTIVLKRFQMHNVICVVIDFV